MLTCTSCGQARPLSHFKVNSNGQPQATCSTCTGHWRQSQSRNTVPSESSPLTQFTSTPPLPSAPHHPQPVHLSLRTGTSPAAPPQPQLRSCSNCKFDKPLHDFLSHTGKYVKKCSVCRPAPPAKRTAADLASTPTPQPHPKRNQQQDPPAQPQQRPAAPQFLRRGQNSQDSPVTAMARREYVALQRQYRLDLRHNPDLPPIPDEATFIEDRRITHYRNVARQPASSTLSEFSATPSLPSQQRQGSILSSNGDPFHSTDSFQSRRDPPADSGHQSSPGRAERHRHVDPALGVHPEDWDLIKNFHEALDNNNLQVCNYCQKRWFGLRLSQGKCVKCKADDKARQPGQPSLYSADNAMAPRAPPPNLLPLTQIEEILVARVHMHMQVRQIRGQQHRYTGHICSFIRDTAKVYNKLPVLPNDVEILILKPSNMVGGHPGAQQYQGHYRVRQSVVKSWLLHLKANHPGYRDVEIDQDVLNQLPRDGDVEHLIPTIAIDAVLAEDSVPEDQPQPEEAVIPNHITNLTELQRLQQALNGTQSRSLSGQAPGASRPHHLTLPTFSEHALSEYDRTQPLLSLAFPTLYPYGDCDFKSPRLRSVTIQQYADHLLKYQDHRFAKHPRWSYAVLNMALRSQSDSGSKWLMRPSNLGRGIPGVAGRAAQVEGDELQGLFEDPEQREPKILIQRIVRQAAKIRGTRPYWAEKRRDLEAYVRNLGKPDLFLTFSAADYWWDSLQKHFPNYYAWKQGTASEAIKISRTNLKENPHIAAYHFEDRFNLFLEHVLTPLFGIEDSWFRYEWQGRGSTHCHGFVWFKDGNRYWDNERITDPSLRKLFEQDDMSSGSVREVFARFWAKYVVAITQSTANGVQETSPLSLASHEQQNTAENLHSVVGRVQKHGCTQGYCLRPKKNSVTDEKCCRFHFPFENRQVPAVIKDDKTKYWSFHPQRNNEWLNAYNPTITLGWLANTDISPCTSIQGVINYIAKYATKSEQKSLSYQELTQNLLNGIQPATTLQSLAKRLMNKLIGERDYSQQEVAHLLLTQPLAFGTREVLSVDCRLQTEQDTPVDITDGNIQSRGKSPLTHYLDRPPGAERATYLQYLKYAIWSARGGKKRKARVLNLWPRYGADPNAPDHEDFCRVKVLLHHHFRTLHDLGREEENPRFASWKAVWADCQANHTHVYEPDTLDYVEVEPTEDEFEDAEGDEPVEGEPNSWEELARERPGRQAVTISANTLGSRDIDRAKDWSPHATSNLRQDWWRQQRATHPKDLAVRHARQSDIDTLQGKQRVLYDLIIQHYANTLRGQRLKQLLVHVDGRAGTGKSYLIWLLSSKLDDMKPRNASRSPITRAAPTGVAAHNIEGYTLHSLLSLPRKGALKDLSPRQLTQAQIKLQDCQYLIIDEKSMVGLRTLHWIDQRLRQILPQQDLPFGGLSILLFGDFHQLPPVAAKPLFCQEQLTGINENRLGRDVYQLFTTTVELDVLMRQQGGSTQQVLFRTILEELRESRLSVASWQGLTTRIQAMLPDQEVRSFDSAIRLYGRKDIAQAYNEDRLSQLGQPVLLIKASHTGGALAAHASTDQAENLVADLLLCIGARVMLTSNVWTERGLVNGSMGEVADILWEEGADVTQTLPHVIMVRFTGYDHPEGQNDAVPIFKQTNEFTMEGNKNCSRTQFPLRLGYAITIHKSQGLTLDKAVLNLRDREFSPGLNYVAVSRVKSLAGLMFEEAFDYSQFRKVGGATERWRDEDRNRRRRLEWL